MRRRGFAFTVRSVLGVAPFLLIWRERGRIVKDETCRNGKAVRSLRSLPVHAGFFDRLRASPFVPFYEDRIGPDSAFTVYSGHMSPVLLDEDDSAIEDEYWHLRREATLFDVPEHAIEIVGADAARFLDHLMPRHIASLKVGRCRYSLMCYPDGGILMDGILVRLAEDRFRYVLADGEIFGWLRAHQPAFDVAIVDTEDWVLQIQGPRSLAVLAALCDGNEPDPFPYFSAARVTLAGQPLLATRTGWTSELGFELYVPSYVDHGALWDHLTGAGVRHGLRFASMACMNIRRIEAGILNNGTDMSPAMTPYAAGLGHFLSLDKEAFIGRDALLAADRRPRLVGLRASARIRPGMALVLEGKAVGRITAAAYSPHLGHHVGYALFEKTGDWIGRQVACGDDGVPGETLDLPFYDSDKLIPRGKAVAHV